MEEAKKPAAKGILMTEGPIARQILAFTLPLLLGNVFQQLYNTVDSVVVGNFVGKEALATVGSSSSMIGMIVSLFMGIGVGASVIISQYYGAGNLKKMENAIYTAIAFGIAAGVLLTVIGIVVSPVILRWMKTPETVMEGSVIFLRIYFLGSLPSMLYNIGSSIFHAFGDSKKPLLYLIIASIVNILLDLLFVAVFRWGIAGAGYATVLSQTISAVLTYMTLTGKRSIYRLELKLDSFLQGRAAADYQAGNTKRPAEFHYFFFQCYCTVQHKFLWRRCHGRLRRLWKNRRLCPDAIGEFYHGTYPPL